MCKCVTHYTTIEMFTIACVFISTCLVLHIFHAGCFLFSFFLTQCCSSLPWTKMYASGAGPYSAALLLLNCCSAGRSVFPSRAAYVRLSTRLPARGVQALLWQIPELAGRAQVRGSSDDRWTAIQQDLPVSTTHSIVSVLINQLLSLAITTGSDGSGFPAALHWYFCYVS